MKIIQKIFCLLLACIYSYKLNTQTLYPKVISVNANSKAMEGIQWDWSFGEQLLVTPLYGEKNFIITTGFLQNEWGVGVNFKPLELRSPFKIGPNPMIHNVIINSDQSGIIISSIEIINTQGQLLKMVQGPFSGIQFEQNLSLVSANTGIYFIVIHYVVGNSILKKQIFKIIKQQ